MNLMETVTWSYFSMKIEVSCDIAQYLLVNIYQRFVWEYCYQV